MAALSQVLHLARARGQACPWGVPGPLVLEAASPQQMGASSCLAVTGASSLLEMLSQAASLRLLPGVRSGTAGRRAPARNGPHKTGVPQGWSSGAVEPGATSSAQHLRSILETARREN